MMKKIYIILSIALILCSFKSDNYLGITAGEKLIFVGSYNMSGLMTQLAQVTLSTETVSTSKNSYLHLSCELSTYSKWDKFFKIRDLYESYVNPITMQPSLYKRSIDEGGYTKKEKYIFKGTTIISISKRKNRPETTNTFSIGASTQDVISLFYKVRTIDFSTLQPGQTKSFTAVFDEEQVPITLKYLGNETISVGNLGEKMCYKIAIAAKTGVLKGKDKKCNLAYRRCKKSTSFDEI